MSSVLFISSLLVWEKYRPEQSKEVDCKRYVSRANRVSNVRYDPQPHVNDCFYSNADSIERMHSVSFRSLLCTSRCIHSVGWSKGLPATRWNRLSSFIVVDETIFLLSTTSVTSLVFLSSFRVSRRIVKLPLLILCTISLGSFVEEHHWLSIAAAVKQHSFFRILSRSRHLQGRASTKIRHYHKSNEFQSLQCDSIRDVIFGASGGKFSLPRWFSACLSRAYISHSPYACLCRCSIKLFYCIHTPHR